MSMMAKDESRMVGRSRVSNISRGSCNQQEQQPPRMNPVALELLREQTSFASLAPMSLSPTPTHHHQQQSYEQYDDTISTCSSSINTQKTQKVDDVQLAHETSGCTTSLWQQQQQHQQVNQQQQQQQQPQQPRYSTTIHRLEHLSSLSFSSSATPEVPLLMTWSDASSSSNSTANIGEWTRPAGYTTSYNITSGSDHHHHNSSYYVEPDGTVVAVAFPIPDPALQVVTSLAPMTTTTTASSSSSSVCSECNRSISNVTNHTSSNARKTVVIDDLFDPSGSHEYDVPTVGPSEERIPTPCVPVLDNHQKQSSTSYNQHETTHVVTPPRHHHPSNPSILRNKSYQNQNAVVQVSTNRTNVEEYTRRVGRDCSTTPPRHPRSCRRATPSPTNTSPIRHGVVAEDNFQSIARSGHRRDHSHGSEVSGLTYSSADHHHDEVVRCSYIPGRLRDHHQTSYSSSSTESWQIPRLSHPHEQRGRHVSCDASYDTPLSRSGIRQTANMTHHHEQQRRHVSFDTPHDSSSTISTTSSQRNYRMSTANRNPYTVSHKVRAEYDAYHALYQDIAYKHAMSAGYLWQSMVGQHVRFPSHWWNGARSPPMGMNHQAKEQQPGFNSASSSKSRWMYLSCHRVSGHPYLNQVVPRRNSPGQILLHVIVQDLVTWKPVQDIVIGCFHSNARGVRRTPHALPDHDHCHELYLAVRKRCDEVSVVDSLLTAGEKLEDCARESPLMTGTRHQVTNVNLNAIFGEDPPKRTVIILENELHTILVEAAADEEDEDEQNDDASCQHNQNMLPALLLLQAFLPHPVNI